MPDHRFDTDTAGTLVEPTRVDVTISGDWNVDGHIINGGYLQAVTLRAVTTALGGDLVLVGVSTTYSAPAAAGPGAVHVEVHRAGRTVTTATATLRQGETVVLIALVTLGSAEFVTAQRPPASRPDVTAAAESIRPPSGSMPGPPGLTEFIEYAFVPERSGWLRGDFSAGPQVTCWLRFRDDRPIDRLALLAFVDIAPPVSFAVGRFGWAPTLQLQTGLFADPAPGPVLLELTGRPYDGAVVAEHGSLWDSDGVLVAGSQQIALAPRH